MEVDADTDYTHHHFQRGLEDPLDFKQQTPLLLYQSTVKSFYITTMYEILHQSLAELFTKHRVSHFAWYSFPNEGNNDFSICFSKLFAGDIRSSQAKAWGQGHIKERPLKESFWTQFLKLNSSNKMKKIAQIDYMIIYCLFLPDRILSNRIVHKTI